MELDGYEKIKTVGKGAFGTAVLYRHIATDTLVVIKEINLLELNGAERQMALNEVQVLSSLHHPHIIRYLGSWEREGVLRIEMEYAAGGTLAQLISRSSRLAERDVLTLFQQCVAAIRYMHENNILHRDLKTANVFLTKENIIKVGDFGISKVMTTKGQAQTVLGTPYYISPEMCEGKQYDHKSDVWALGCILYEMACLQKTFQGNNLPALVNKIMKGDFEPIPKEYSEGLRNLVRDLLQKDPILRPTAAKTYERVDKLLQQTKQSAAPLSSHNSVRSVLYQLSGRGTSFSYIPIQLPATLKITQVAVSNTHYIVVSSDNIVFTWGEGKRGQLGHPEAPMWLQHPTVVKRLNDRRITQVEAGDGFSVFLSDSGVLMTCGDGTFGCLGHGDWSNVIEPKVVESLLNSEVSRVACGDHHCLALNGEGQVMVWGRGQAGRLGTGAEQDCCSPVVIPTPERIRSIHAGIDCSALITHTGAVYMCGRNNHNKLGLSSSILVSLGITKPLLEHNINKITKVKTLSSWKIVDISFAIKHSAALTECGRIVTMGSNDEAQTGHSSLTPHVVSAIEDIVICNVACGPTYTLVSSVQNALYFWGTCYTTPPSELSVLQSETVKCPEQVLALYASPAQITRGEILNVAAVKALWDTVLVLVDTTLPPVQSVTGQADDQVEFDSVGPIPQWITAELQQAQEPWYEQLFDP